MRAGRREKGEREAVGHKARGKPDCPLLLLQSRLLGRAGDGKGVSGLGSLPAQLPLSLEMSTLEAIKSRVSGRRWYPSFLFWLLETPQAGNKGFGKNPPRDFLVCLKHGGKTSLQLLPGSFEVPGTQCPASRPSSPPPMEELERRVPSFMHTRFFFFCSPFFLLQKLQGSDVSIPTVGVRSIPPFQGRGSTQGS